MVAKQKEEIAGNHIIEALIANLTLKTANQTLNTTLLTLKGSSPIFPLHAPAYDDAPPYYVWLQKVERPGRYRPEKNPDTRTDFIHGKHGHSYSNTPIPTLRYGGWGGGR